MFNGVISRKLSSLDRTLDELETLRPVSVSSLGAEWTIRRAIERDLQVLSEIALDVCQRILSLRGQSPAPSAVEAVERCVALGAITARDSYTRMIKMRNLIVHRYDDVDPKVLADVVNNKLETYRDFRDEVVAFVERQEATES